MALLVLVCLLGCLFFGFCVNPSQGSKPSSESMRTEVRVGESVSLAPPERTRVEDAIGEGSAATTLLASDAKQKPDEVQLPTIDGHPADENQRQFLRMLAHAMAGSGLSCAMPTDLRKEYWDLLEAWTLPLRAERAELSDQCQQVVTEAVNSRLDAGHYEIRQQAPAALPPNAYVAWRHTIDARGNSIVHFVHIAHGELPKSDVLRERSSLIDRDMAMLARTLFDRFPK